MDLSILCKIISALRKGTWSAQSVLAFIVGTKNSICILTLCMLGNFSMTMLSSADFFQNKLLLEILSGTSVIRLKRFGSRSGPRLVLIWVKTVCKGYQQTTKSLLARKE